MIPDDVYRDHIGIAPQRQAGLSSVGASVLRGRISGEQLHQLAELAEQYGSGELRTTIMQNILIVNVPNEKAAALVLALNGMELHVDVSAFWRGAIACTGTEFCKLAIAETKGFSKWLVSEMEERLPGFDQQIKLHVTGCTNSCGQHWIADIGLEGKKIKKDGRSVDAFYFCVGGAVGRFAGPLDRWAIARRRKMFRMLSSGCCVDILRLVGRKKICERTSLAPMTIAFALNLRVRLSIQWNVTLRQSVPAVTRRESSLVPWIFFLSF
ncbi:hypothetical protein [Tunturiibacter gelidiferens]|uniref:hypothetical protein n=1 Tax=Tunturiibacter gelidiferens TaxID=3069689 RepID=UPI003D9B8302